TKWQQVKFVTLPNLRTMIAILLIMNISKIFNSDFGLFWNVPLASGSILDVTQTIDTYVYRALSATGGNLGMTTAAGVFQNVVGFVCMLIANSVVKRIDADSSLF
nr:sugar ABC transporter permease [Lachnospiraceae bacterium]